MDDAARLVSELHHKLAELDGKVAAYQRDMLTEFHKHMDECLRKYPDHVSKQVSRAIAESMSTGRYPALSPPTTSDTPDSPARDGRKSPPPVLRHTSGTPKEGPRSPHAREKEFQGLFTPAYLPLLESRGRADRSPPVSPQPMSDGPSPAPPAENVKMAEEPKQAVSARPEGRPVTARRLTDQSMSSTSSSGSDAKARRSALRRSSSANKSSPRRVRFEFEGEEVFPASSLSQAPTVTLAVASGAEPQPEAETPALATKDKDKDESSAYSGTSLLDVEGDEDLLPRPRKVSSTQALQALTRSPLEEGSVWTVVDSSNEELDKMNGAKQPETRDLPTRVDSQATIQADGAEEEPGDGQLGTPIEEQADYDEYDNDSDEEVLSMRPKGKSPSPTTPKTPFTRPPHRPAAISTTAHEPNGNPDIDEDDDPFFDLDDEGVHPTSHSKPPPQKYLPDSPSDDEDTTPGRLRKAAQSSSSASKIPPVSPSAVLFGHSIGSYMGRSMTINPIKDPKLYDEIAGMKDVQFFVGSIDDCTEAEAAAMGSYRAGAGAAASLAGRSARGVDVAPRSFSERLALEEEMERRAEAGEGE